MYLDEIIETLMNLDCQTCPCECGVPCPDFTPNQSTYCKNGFCLDAMTRLIRETVQKGG